MVQALTEHNSYAKDYGDTPGSVGGKVCHGGCLLGDHRCQLDVYVEPQALYDEVGRHIWVAMYTATSVDVAK